MLQKNIAIEKQNLADIELFLAKKRVNGSSEQTLYSELTYLRIVSKFLVDRGKTFR